MSDIRFAPAPGFTAFVSVSVEKPRTVLSIHLSAEDAERAVYAASLSAQSGIYIAEVREVPLNVGFANSPIWGWLNGTVQRFGALDAHVADAVGITHGDHALLPNFTDEEWTEYGVLAKRAFRNPVADAMNAHHEGAIQFHRQSLPAKVLFAVLSPEGQLTALLSAERNPDTAAAMFALALSRHPELEGHSLRAVYAGADTLTWGDVLEIPAAADITKRLLGEHPDGTVFTIRGPWDEYTLRNGKLMTEDGYEADVLSLKRDGLRVQNSADIVDAAYAKMARLVERASSF